MKLFTTLFISLLGMNYYNASSVDHSVYNKEITYHDLVSDNISVLEYNELSSRDILPLNSYIGSADGDVTLLSGQEEDVYFVLVNSSNTKLNFSYSIYNKNTQNYEYFSNVNTIRYEVYIDDNDFIEKYELYFFHNDTDNVRWFSTEDYDFETINFYFLSNLPYDVLCKYEFNGEVFNTQQLSFRFKNVVSKLYYPKGHNGSYWLKNYLRTSGIEDLYEYPYFSTTELIRKKGASEKGVAEAVGKELVNLGNNIMPNNNLLNYIYNGFYGSKLEFATGYYLTQVNSLQYYVTINYSHLIASYLYYEPILNNLSGNVISSFDRDNLKYVTAFDYQRTPFLIFEPSRNIVKNVLGGYITIEEQISLLLGAISGGSSGYDNPLDVFTLLTYAFTSFFTLFEYRIGQFELSLFVVAPLVVGFLLWLIHLVKKG